MSTLTCIISAIIVIGIVVVALAIVGQLLDSLLRPVRDLAWAFRLQGVRKKLQARANALEPQVKTLVEKKSREHSLHLREFLTREESLRRDGIEIGDEPPGWTFLLGKGDQPTPSDIRASIILRTEGWYHIEPPQRNWFVADQLVFDVGSAYPKSVPLATTNSTNLAEIAPLMERIFAENAV
ncbi:MAG: hypothetical protein HY327_10960 [Chloroflexi bacterium]|nr:hypothetical protein [Chloroflexota bacterium]